VNAESANRRPAIALRNLTVAYRGHPAVHHVSGDFAAGSLTAVVGPNGAGKSSLLAAIGGSIRPAQGEVTIAEPARGHIAWLPQQAAIDRSFPIRVFDMVAFGHWSSVGSFKALSDAQHEQVHAALQAVGLGGFERRSLSELSAGQFQRVLFARVLLQDAPVILLDEPFNAIDARTTAELLGVVARWHAEARTVIAVVHDLDQVREHFEHTLLLARRCVAWGPTAEVLCAENLFRARQMAERWDDDAPRCEEQAA
jgi:zinc/manganese transport system ATP-binding protein